MESPQLRQRARRSSQETMGMLSNQAIRWPQRGQRLPGETMLCPFGDDHVEEAAHHRPGGEDPERERHRHAARDLRH
jgi:hypothetical protein